MTADVAATQNAAPPTPSCATTSSSSPSSALGGGVHECRAASHRRGRPRRRV